MKVYPAASISHDLARAKAVSKQTHSRSNPGCNELAIAVINSQKLNGRSGKEVRKQLPILAHELEGDDEAGRTPSSRLKKQLKESAVARRLIVSAARTIVSGCYRTDQEVLHKVHFLGETFP